MTPYLSCINTQAGTGQSGAWPQSSLGQGRVATLVLRSELESQHVIVDIIVREKLCSSQLLELITELREKEALQGCNAPAGLQLRTAGGSEDQQNIVLLSRPDSCVWSV